ncbi:MAG: hypothetical protein ACI9MR_001976 [Myxococcota bacterium]|jgi:hypothetical protein
MMSNLMEMLASLAPSKGEEQEESTGGSLWAALRGMDWEQGEAALASSDASGQRGHKGKKADPGLPEVVRVLAPGKEAAAISWCQGSEKSEASWVDSVATGLGVAPTVDAALVQAVAAFSLKSLGSVPKGKLPSRVDGKAGKNTRAHLLAAYPALASLDGWGPSNNAETDAPKAEPKAGAADIVTVDAMAGFGGDTEKPKPAAPAEEKKDEGGTPTNDGLIDPLVSDKAKQDLPAAPSSKVNNAWVHATGDFTSHPNMPDDLKAAYKKCVKAATDSPSTCA